MRHPAHEESHIHNVVNFLDNPGAGQNNNNKLLIFLFLTEALPNSMYASRKLHHELNHGRFLKQQFHRQDRLLLNHQQISHTVFLLPASHLFIPGRYPTNFRTSSMANLNSGTSFLFSASVTNVTTKSLQGVGTFTSLPLRQT